MNAKLNPAATVGQNLFLWAGAAFLVTLLLAAFMVPEQPGTDITAVAPSDTTIEGKKIFRGEGCIECHSLMVRPSDSGTGTPMSTTDFNGYSEYPGSMRIGPDLQTVDQALSGTQLMARLTNPYAIQPDTVMPYYNHLTDRQISSLIDYLESIASVPGITDRIREANDLETAIPNELIMSLVGHVDEETGMLVQPVGHSPEALLTGMGIYNSRCGVCHGAAGYAEHTELTPASDLVSKELTGRSPVYIYWRISEGVPGTAMPSWGKTLSDTAIWHLVSYIQSMLEDEASGLDIYIEPEYIDHMGFTGNDTESWPVEITEWYLPDNGNVSDTADSASEEEGTTEGDSMQAPSGSGTSADNIPAEEDSP